MTKRAERTLQLRRETLRRLTSIREAELALVAGGARGNHGSRIGVIIDSNECDTLSATSKYC